jgi:hypothetical protein
MGEGPSLSVSSLGFFGGFLAFFFLLLAAGATSGAPNKTVAAAAAPSPRAPYSERRVTRRSAVISASVRVTVSSSAACFGATTISFVESHLQELTSAQVKPRPRMATLKCGFPAPERARFTGI